MPLRRSVVLLTAAAAALTLSSTATAEPAPQPQAEAQPAMPERPRVSKTDAQRTMARERGKETAPAARTAAADVRAAASSAGSVYTPVTQVRVLDTRNGIGAPSAPLGAGGTLTLDLSSRVPADATAVVLNVTGVSPTRNTYLTVWPAGQSRPNASNLNVSIGETRPNAVTAALGDGAALRVFNNAGTTHVLADLAGYYAPGDGSRFTSTDPARVLDTRSSGGALGPRSTRTVNLSGRVPASATAVTLNLTGVGATVDTYVTAWPTGQSRPNASALNLTRGATTPNQVTVALGGNRTVSLYNHSGSVHLLADLAGYYATDRGDSFYQLTPLRMFDTRRDATPLPGGYYQEIPLDPLLPASANAVVFNLTGTNVTAANTYLTAYPEGNIVPNASNLNLVRGQTSANLVTVALSADDGFNVYNHQGEVDFLTDVAGYFAPAPPPCTTDCVHSWGDNEFALLGVGTTGGTSGEPGRIDGLSGITEVTGGELNAYALRDDGAVYSWGLDDLAGLGTGEPYGLSTVPVRVNNLSGVTDIAAGLFAAYAVDSQGNAWAWGDNFNGALGDGTMTERRSPVRVQGLSGDVVQVAGGYDTGYALLADGTVWVWGTNGGSFGNGEYGTGCDQLPAGPGCRTLTPIQVPGLTDVTSIAATRSGTFAVKDDGSVWAWGFNDVGQLGLGTVGGPACQDDIFAPNCLVLSPTRIDGLSGVAEIAHGSQSATYARTTDGTVLSWGFNADGQLGDGTTGENCTDPGVPNCVRTSPAPVPGLTGVTDLAAGAQHALALRSDGSVVAWGMNNFHQVNGGSPVVDTPVQVAVPGSATTVGASGWSSYAVS
ncbi:RCC1 domain-containing protein [Actinophytocola gossypii]|uniref:RCC1-like domain-containing protein n=1 Tax=Actinophytocola gossypii TaxID=2812003 RepID=A0ABT2JGZ0_9PSEU|nr:hypothetical protein [Actinophytocola gossypii]MCT2586690.1 hypothetical protein [Actinophytocola gossypii]